MITFESCTKGTHRSVMRVNKMAAIDKGLKYILLHVEIIVIDRRQHIPERR
jgi:hypothetical protein